MNYDIQQGGNMAGIASALFIVIRTLHSHDYASLTENDIATILGAAGLIAVSLTAYVQRIMAGKATAVGFKKA